MRASIISIVVTGVVAAALGAGAVYFYTNIQDLNSALADAQKQNGGLSVQITELSAELKTVRGDLEKMADDLKKSQDETKAFKDSLEITKTQLQLALAQLQAAQKTGEVLPKQSNFCASATLLESDSALRIICLRLGALTDGLVAYYTLDNTTADSYGNYDLTNNGVVFNPGKVGFAADCENDENDYLAAGDVFDPGGTLSVFAWIKLETASQDNDNMIQWLVGKDHDTQGRAFAFGIAPTGKLYVQINGKDATKGNSVLVSSVWYHVGFTWDDSANTITFYLNGSSDGAVSQSANIPPTTASLDICRRSYTGSQSNTDGIIDEVGIWNRVLSASEVSSLYNSGKGR